MADNEQPDLSQLLEDQSPVEVAEEQPVAEVDEAAQVDSKPERVNFFENNSHKVIVAIAGVALAAIFGAATLANKSGASNERQQTTTGAPANPGKSTETSTSEKESKPSESEARYANYLKTLSPEQLAVRESLNPDALAEMDDAQLTEAFTIKSKEVVVDGKINPSLYVEALIARAGAIANSGLSDKEYAKWGGLDKFGTDTIDKVSYNYCKVESKALFGTVIDDSTLNTTLTLGSGIDRAIKSGLKPQPRERYHYRATVELASIESTEGGNGSLDISFRSDYSDNWETNVMLQQSNLQRDPANGVDTWTITGVHITNDGVVLPTNVQ